MPRSLPAALAAGLLLAAASATTTATRVGNAITITGDDGPNVISVDSNGNFIMYRDTSGPYIVAGANDTLRGIAGNDQIDGGAGDDTIHGGADDDPGSRARRSRSPRSPGTPRPGRCACR
jgi:Ca2+-binding RTX toxin-like protein